MITLANDLMMPSDPDTVALAEAVEERFLTVCSLHFRQHEEEINIPPSLDRDLLLWRALRVRHKRGDFRNSRSELLATRAVAQWVMDINCGLRGQASQTLKWRD